MPRTLVLTLSGFVDSTSLWSTKFNGTFLLAPAADSGLDSAYRCGRNYLLPWPSITTQISGRYRIDCGAVSRQFAGATQVRMVATCTIPLFGVVASAWASLATPWVDPAGFDCGNFRDSAMGDPQNGGGNGWPGFTINVSGAAGTLTSGN
jgi:hypothetical protein